MRSWRVAVVALLVGLAALASGPAWSISERRAYLRDLKRFTQETRIYHGFQTALILRGTYLHPRMRADLAAERRRLINPTPEDHQAFVARMQADGAAYHDVVFSAMTPLKAARRFGEADTGWVIWLEADGTRQELVSVEHIRRPSALHRELYAHMTQWSELWIARFDKTVQNPSKVVFHVGSGYGNDDLVWMDLPAGP